MKRFPLETSILYVDEMGEERKSKYVEKFICNRTKKSIWFVDNPIPRIIDVETFNQIISDHLRVEIKTILYVVIPLTSSQLQHLDDNTYYESQDSRESLKPTLGIKLKKLNDKVPAHVKFSPKNIDEINSIMDMVLKFPQV